MTAFMHWAAASHAKYACRAVAMITLNLFSLYVLQSDCTEATHTWHLCCNVQSSIVTTASSRYSDCIAFHGTFCPYNKLFFLKDTIAVRMQ